MLMEKYNNLISAYVGDEDALEIIKSDMKRMNDYGLQRDILNTVVPSDVQRSGTS